MSTFIVWNARGIANDNTATQIKFFVKKYKLSFMAILEPMTKDSKAPNFGRSVNLPQAISNEKEGGKIWIVAKNDWKMEIIHIDNQSISFLGDWNKTKCLFTVVYAKCDYKKRRTLWKSCEDLNVTNVPWLLAGDFNCITKDSEKIGGHPFSNTAKKEFCEFIDHLSLYTLPNKGPKFTWAVTRHGKQILEKLDRVLVNNIWLKNFPHVTLSHLERTFSDHSPLLLHDEVNQVNGPTPFRFYRMWSTHPGFKEEVKKSWDSYCPLKGMQAVVFKLKRLKKVLKTWNWEVFGDIFQKLNNLRDKITQLEDEEKHETFIEEHRNAYKKLLLQEEMYFKQKSRVVWLKEGDRNTKFFHQSMLNKYRKTQINYLIDKDGDLIRDDAEMGSMAVDYFYSQFSKENMVSGDSMINIIPKLIYNAHNNMLIASPSMEEIKQAVFSMPVDSAPGPDGFSPGFFIDCWEILKQDIFDAVVDFFTHKFLSQGYTSSILALIPKKDDAHSLSDFRPICLCQVIYKIFSKILANRLAIVLPSIISPQQGGFTQGRTIAENISLAQEISHSLGAKTRGGNVIFKLDMSKAFDRVDWDFLFKILKAFGFCDDWIALMKACVCSNFFSISLKGKTYGYFPTSRGLRQGDPLSPMLFIISEEPFSRGLTNMIVNGELIKYKVPKNCPNVSHLLYADDCLIFANGSKNILSKLMGFINDYADQSGQKINIDKSYFYTHHTTSVTRKEIIHSVTAMPEGTLPFIYLGAPLTYKKLTIHDYDFLVTKITKKVAAWKGKFLSYGGKMTLINSVLASIPLHILAVLNPAQTVIDIIERTFSHFFWGENKGKTNKSWIRWGKIARPRGEGGLGVRNLKEVMDALHAKLIWIIKTKETLFAKYMRGKYCEDGRQNIYRSFLWKSLSNIWDRVTANIDVVEGSFVWKPDTQGLFSTKSAWGLLREGANKWTKAQYVWKSYIPLKISVFLWKLWQNGVPTDDKIKKCGIPITSKCSCCLNCQEEDAAHLFGLSEIANEVWAHFSKKFGVNSNPNWSWRRKCSNWWDSAKGLNQFKMLSSVIPNLIIWELWIYRNSRRHDDIPHSSYGVIKKINSWLKEVNCLISPKSLNAFLDNEILEDLNINILKVQVKKPILLRWSPPIDDNYKLNIDGASRGNPGHAGAGGVLRDKNSEVFFAFSEYLGKKSNNYAEMFALYSGLMIAYQLDIYKMEIETDSLLLANWYNNNTSPPWELWEIWKKIKEFSNILDVTVEHVYREQNTVADVLAKEGAQGVNHVYMGKQNLPSTANSSCLLDSLGIYHWRMK